MPSHRTAARAATRKHHHPHQIREMFRAILQHLGEQPATDGWQVAHDSYVVLALAARAALPGRDPKTGDNFSQALFDAIEREAARTGELAERMAEYQAERMARKTRVADPEQAEDEARAIEAENRRIEALQAAQDWQAAFWSALRELERVLGVDVDGSQDLGEATVESLLQEGRPLKPERPTPAEEPWLCPDSVEQDALADQEAEEAAFTVVFATRADLLHALGDPADPGTDEGLEALAHQVWAGADFDVAGGR